MNSKLTERGFTTSITSLYACQKDRGNSKHQYITSYIHVIVTFKCTLHLYSPCSQRFTGVRTSLLCHRNPVETCVFLNCVHPVITRSGPGSLYQSWKVRSPEDFMDDRGKLRGTPRFEGSHRTILPQEYISLGMSEN